MSTPAPASVRPEKTAFEYIDDLVRGFTTFEWVTQPIKDDDGKWRTKRRMHTVTHPSLLDQIEQTVTGSTTEGQVFRSNYGPKPAGRLDCIAFLQRLDQQSRDLAKGIGIEPGQPVRERLLRLAGAIGDASHPTVKSWWATARVLTQHDSAPFAPNEPCPECGYRGTLRVRFDPQVAICVQCYSMWDGERFGQLAVWVEWASRHLAGPRHLVPATDYDTADARLGYLETCGECEQERQVLMARSV